LGFGLGRLSGWRIILSLRLPQIKEWHCAGLVPGHGNGWYATEFHRFSYYP